MKLLVSTRGPCWAVAGQDRHFASQPHGVELNHPCGLTVDGTSPSASMCPSPSRVRLRQRTAPSRSEDALIRGGHPGTRCMTRLTVTGNECRRRVLLAWYRLLKISLWKTIPITRSHHEEVATHRDPTCALVAHPTGVIRIKVEGIPLGRRVSSRYQLTGTRIHLPRAPSRLSQPGKNRVSSTPGPDVQTLLPESLHASESASTYDDWGAPAEENDYLPDTETTATSLTLPRLPRSPERLPSQVNRGVSPSCNRSRRAPEFRQRSPSPQYQPRMNPGEVTSPRERFQDAKEMFRAMEREAIARPVLSRQREVESHPAHRTFRDIDKLPCQFISRETVARSGTWQVEQIRKWHVVVHVLNLSRKCQKTSPVSRLSKRPVTLEAVKPSNIPPDNDKVINTYARRDLIVIDQFTMIPFLCDRVESARQTHEDQPTRQHPASNSSTTGHEHLIRRNHSEVSERENDISYRARPRPRTHHYAMERPPEQEVSRPRPRSFYENPTVGRDFRDQRNVADPREARDFRDRAHVREIREKVRARATTYQELSEHERYPGLDRDSARPPLEIVPTPGRYRHSYAEPPRLGLAALHPY
ncbi:hypothetical protein WN48_00978 [Eufriesea mexicana]|uniref:Uncharacterized protein n=1 Tax=Eufriesea mexicana TaxID=516756 RepID=A0A310SMD1_9HYME|nr:hypothetical protein WN48_00978 [Eufriesea mexicana]